MNILSTTSENCHQNQCGHIEMSHTVWLIHTLNRSNSFSIWSSVIEDSIFIFGKFDFWVVLISVVKLWLDSALLDADCGWTAADEEGFGAGCSLGLLFAGIMGAAAFAVNSGFAADFIVSTLELLGLEVGWALSWAWSRLFSNSAWCNLECKKPSFSL